MKKILIGLLCALFPALAFADSSVSFFTPPSTDYSVIFLGNLFGQVDGVLYGSGSQIMGKMFLVFNSAVLALGGIVVTYTLIVATMNTAHEGQFLGQKWSSIWIPIRSTIGLALLIPKASGYCLMQIFIMWIVVQGVGAADRVWDAALNYLDLGGVFMQIQTPLNPTTSSGDAVEKIAKGESAALQGQVCMRGLQSALEITRKSYLEQKNSGGGPCLESSPYYDTDWQQFCTSSVPDFISTVNAVEVASNGKNSVTMPNFTDGSLYQQFNGICGTLAWNQLDMASETNNLDYVSAEEVETLNNSRPIAVQQMYIDLYSLSSAMVKNDPDSHINENQNLDPTKRYSTIAQNQFGIPYLTTTQQACSVISTDCGAWSYAPGGNTQVFILSGFEFINTLNDYNTIMLPVLNLMMQNDNATANNKAHEFVTDAHTVGWSMAGAYFFDMTSLNGTAAGGTTEVDNTSGLETSTPFSANTLMAPFNNGSCSGQYALLCKLFKMDSSAVTAINNLITGESVESGLTANVSSSSGHKAETGVGSSSVYGYITNASMVNLPGQPGLSTPVFKFNLNIVPGESLLSIPHMSFACGPKFLGFCLWKGFGDIVWNTIIKQFLLIIINFITALFDYAIQQLLVLPLTVMMTILNNGVQLLNTSQTHPIVALAYMGTGFINYVTSLYFQMLALSTVFSMGFGAIILILILPFLAAWMSIMFAIGFLDAYYVPFLPYMMFTFGVVAWFLAVIEAMVAGPIVGLGIAHPEGHDAFGKAEAAFTILINVFLRPALMILGYIAGIVLSYVAVYTINAGFGHFMQFFMPPSSEASTNPIAAASDYAKSASDDFNAAIGSIETGANTAASVADSAASAASPYVDQATSAAAAGISAATDATGTTDAINSAISTGTDYANTAVSAATDYANTAASVAPGYVDTATSAASSAASAAGINSSNTTTGITSNTAGTWTATAGSYANNYTAPAEGAGTPYTNYAAMYAGFFCLLVYTTIYLTVVEKSFTPIYMLPDQVSRWMGGQPEQFGKETAQWADATKEQVKKGGEETGKAAREVNEQFAQAIASKGGKGGGKGKGGVSPK
ncbi:MAG: type IVB secretion system protein DotA [Gammaproteobacteria bacterium]